MVELYEGDNVIDSHGVTGVVYSANNVHNICVIYDCEAGHGMYCIDSNCEEFDPLALIP